MANPVMPARIRRLINVESGLNDGIATPFVSVALAGAATGGQAAGHGPAKALTELAVGIVIGVVVGGVGGVLVNAARQRGWAAEGFAGSAVLGLAVCAYAFSVAVDGNGFIAAFIGGLAFGTTGGRRGEPLMPFVEETGALVSLLVWLSFGAVALVPAMEAVTWKMVLYAILSLTVVRMVPVAVALIGARLGWATVTLVAWFGPRGLASVVFALLALEELGNPVAGRAVAVIAITVVLSVVIHGATAEPLAIRYAKRLADRAAGSAGTRMPDMPDRRLIRRGSPSKGDTPGQGQR